MASMGIEPVVDAIADLDRDRWIEEVGCANLNGSGACHQELDGILGRTDASQAYHGNLYGLGHLIDHA